MTRFLLPLLLSLSPPLLAADRPNIVWIVSEDNSIHYLRHFFEGGAAAPNIEALAAHGLTFDHAFSNSPVCSVARTTLATMCYGPRIGTQFHRKYQLAALPGDLRMFPAYLREAGYYTTNNRKKDYNSIEGKGVWNESSGRASWRNRPDESQPFFHMESHADSHESRLHFSRETYETETTNHDPNAVELAPYFPDTPLFRYTHARYLDRMQIIDGIVGDTVAKLAADGLLEDTFIFYFGDHGGVLPRSKGYPYESGLHVPLVVRVPGKYRNLAYGNPGDRVSGFVSFADFGATALRLAGVEPPSGIDGRAFLGAGIGLDEVNRRNEAFGYADRFDEKYDFIRSLRRGRYHYLRCYQPYLPDGLQNNYRYKMLAYEQWRDLYQAGELSGPPRQFFEPKPVELLFDVEQDPHEVTNLADQPAHAETLRALRGRLQEIVKELPDLSFYPENHLVEQALPNAAAYGQDHQAEITRLVETADLALLSFAEAKPRLEAALNSEHRFVRAWAAMACSAFREEAKPLVPAVEPLLKDPSELVQLRAAEFLGLVGAVNPQPVLTELVNTTDSAVLATEALNSVVWFRDFFGDRDSVDRADFRPQAKGADVMDRLNYLNGVPYPTKAKKKKKKPSAKP